MLSWARLGRRVGHFDHAGPQQDHGPRPTAAAQFASTRRSGDVHSFLLTGLRSSHSSLWSGGNSKLILQRFGLGNMRRTSDQGQLAGSGPFLCTRQNEGQIWPPHPSATILVNVRPFNSASRRTSAAEKVSEGLSPSQVFRLWSAPA